MRKKPIISIIAAIGSKNRAIGYKNKLIWTISEDLKRFKAITTGHPIIMGRKTYESIGRPLPNRTNIIITRDINFAADGCIVVHSLGEAIVEANKVESSEIFIIGGGEIYKEALPLTDRLYLTLINEETSVDTFFPDYSEFTKVISGEDRVDEKTGLAYKFLTLEK